MPAASAAPKRRPFPCWCAGFAPAVPWRKSSFGSPLRDTLSQSAALKMLTAFHRKRGQTGNHTAHPRSGAGKSCKQWGPDGLIVNRPAPFFLHVRPLLLAVCLLGAGRGTIPCPSVREKGSAAHRAGPCFRGRPSDGQRRLQHGIKGQHRRAEIAAISARPAFPQHIARIVHRQTANAFVVVGAPFCHKGSDLRLFLPGQFTAQMLTSRTAGHGSRRHRRCPASRGNHDSGSLWVPAQAREVWAGAASASWSHKDCW